MGDWVGSYTCTQGYTGGTLHINGLRGKDFDGTFKFYPTVKNRTVPEGSYAVYGQYDRESKRILINPGKWLKRPSNYYNTVIVGSFDPETDHFSAYFQGISGCTSFEAQHESTPVSASGKHKAKGKPSAKKPQKKHLSGPQKLQSPTALDATPAPLAPTDDKNLSGIVLSPQTAPPATPPTVQPGPSVAPAAPAAAPATATPVPLVPVAPVNVAPPTPRPASGAAFVPASGPLAPTTTPVPLVPVAPSATPSGTK